MNGTEEVYFQQLIWRWWSHGTFCPVAERRCPRPERKLMRISVLHHFIASWGHFPHPTAQLHKHNSQAGTPRAARSASALKALTVPPPDDLEGFSSRAIEAPSWGSARASPGGPLWQCFKARGKSPAGIKVDQISALALMPDRDLKSGNKAEKFKLSRI